MEFFENGLLISKVDLFDVYLCPVSSCLTSPHLSGLRLLISHLLQDPSLKSLLRLSWVLTLCQDSHSEL